jgi:amino acid transporter
MSTIESASPPGGQLERSAMGTADIVFFVLAGVAPMGVVAALLTLSIALGNGVGVPGTYLIAGVVLALFAAGYVRMSRRITNVGGFYTYARQGLGRRAGGATAYIALLGYRRGAGRNGRWRMAAGWLACTSGRSTSGVSWRSSRRSQA